MPSYASLVTDKVFRQTINQQTQKEYWKLVILALDAQGLAFFPFPHLICPPAKAELNPAMHGKKFRKEVIHPHLRVGIPCYDLSFIANLYLLRKSAVR